MRISRGKTLLFLVFVSCSSERSVGDQGPVPSGALAEVCAQKVACDSQDDQQRCEHADLLEYTKFAEVGCLEQADAWQECRRQHPLRCTELETPWPECADKTEALTECLSKRCDAPSFVPCSTDCVRVSPTQLTCSCDGGTFHYITRCD